MSTPSAYKQTPFVRKIAIMPSGRKGETADSSRRPSLNRHSSGSNDEQPTASAPVHACVLSNPATSAIQPPAILAPEPVDWARLKQWEALQSLLDASAVSPNVQACDSVGRTALHYASGYGESNAVLALLRAGAAVNAGDRFGVTPLHWACLKAHKAIVDLLLQAMADPLVTAIAGVFSGKSALDLASGASSDDLESEALTAALGASLFEQRKVLGRGGFGTVIKAVRRDTGLTVALKEVPKGQGSSEVGSSIGESCNVGTSNHAALRGAQVERDVLTAVRHPFVVTLHCAYQTNHHLYLALDYCGGGDLALHIRQSPNGRLEEAAACFVCAELLLALEALHKASVIHRDVKAENVLVDSAGHIRLADLNAAKRDQTLAKGGRTYSVVGTPFAAAPEVLLGSGYTTAADWWSYGVLLFECVAGRPPYPRDPDPALLHAHARLVQEIVHGDRAALPSAPPLSRAGVSLIDGLLDRDETTRLADASTLRAHAFFAQVRWTVLLAKQVPSPLLPRHLAQRAGGPSLDVFAYPSVLPPDSAFPSGDAAEAGTTAGRGPAGFAGWDYVAGEGEGSKGERLWRRVRSRVDDLARLQGLSRHEFLIAVLLTLSANAATGSHDASVLGALDVP